MTDIEGFLTIYGHSDNLLNNNIGYFALIWSVVSYNNCSLCSYLGPGMSHEILQTLCRRQFGM